MERLVELAETLQCAVIDRIGRMNFPSRHPLNQTFRRPQVVGQADVILTIEMNDHWAALNAFSDRIVRSSRPLYKPGTKIITLGLRDMYLKANFQDFGRYSDIDLAIAGDGEASLPALTAEIRKLIDTDRKSAFEARGKRYAAARLAMLEQAKSDATIGWDASPITTARMCPSSTTRSRTTIRRSSATPSTIPGRIGCGTSISPIVGTASRAVPGRLQRARLARRGSRQQAPRPVDGDV